MDKQKNAKLHEEWIRKIAREEIAKDKEQTFKLLIEFQEKIKGL